MALKVLLKDSDENVLLPITRGELVLDNSGNEAFRSTQFLATSSLPGLMSDGDKQKIDSFGDIISCTLGPTQLSTVWAPISLIFDDKFSSGSYIIQITYNCLIFSGIASIFVGQNIAITESDEIMLHVNGASSENLSLFRIYAKIAKCQNDDPYGQLYLATNKTQMTFDNLSIKLKKLL